MQLVAINQVSENPIKYFIRPVIRIYRYVNKIDATCRCVFGVQTHKHVDIMI